MQVWAGIRCEQCSWSVRNIPDSKLQHVCNNHAQVVGHTKFETYNPRFKRDARFSITELTRWLTKAELPTPDEFRKYDRDTARLISLQSKEGR